AVNSLIGGTNNDQVGSAGVTFLNNGNYVVSSTNWDSGTATNVGAVTWCSGTSGRTGAGSAVNSLVASTPNDQVGCGGVTALSNGNYVVGSGNFMGFRGGVTWGSGMGGGAGLVPAGNSLVGGPFNGQVGSGA